MSEVAGPVRHHPWFGQLYWHRHGERELVGAVPVDPSIRPLRDNGGAEVEVVIQCGQSRDVDAIVDSCQLSAVLVLNQLESIRRQTAAMAPAEWVERYGPSIEALADRLFLDGLEFDPSGSVTAIFDVGDLDQLCAAVNIEGKVQSVLVRA